MGFLLKSKKEMSIGFRSLIAQGMCALRLTLWDPVNLSPLGSSVHVILQQEQWSGLPCPPPGDLTDPGIEPSSLMSPTLAGGFFTTGVT